MIKTTEDEIKIDDENDKIILEGKTITQRVRMSNCTNCKLVGCKLQRSVNLSNCTTCEIIDCDEFQKSVNLIGCTECKIINCDFSYDEEDEKMLNLEDCKRCQVLKSEFHDKDKKGLFICMVGKKSEANLIDHCTFRDHRYPGENGGEPIRIGNSEDSGYWFNTTVQYCYFHDLGGDPESVSIKSCGNVLKNNVHKNCKSSFTIRHGGANTIQDNLFVGYGGIRIHGNTNKILRNLHMNNDYIKYKDNKYKPPLIIDNGNIENDLNFDDAGQPREKPAEYQGCSHSVYARAKNNTIEGNTYHNCEGPCTVWGYKMRNDKNNTTKKCNGKEHPLNGPIHAKSNTFSNNTLVVDDGHGDSIFVAFTDELDEYLKDLEKELKNKRDGDMAGNMFKDKEDNTFKDNQLFGEKAKSGNLPEEVIKKTPSKPPINMPDVDQAALKTALEATVPPS